MLHIFRATVVVAACSLVSACAGTAGRLGIPDCVTDQGTVEAPTVRAGDVWTYRQIDDYTGIDRGTFRLEVTGVRANEVQARLTLPTGAVLAETYDLRWGWSAVSNHGWDWLSRLGYGSATVEFQPPFESMPFPLQAGMRWSDSLVALSPATGARIPIQVNSTARCWEKVTVPGGTFVALRIDRTAYVQDVAWNKSQTTLRMVDWYQPALNRVVMTWHDTSYYDYQVWPHPGLVRGDRIRWELVEYRAGK